MSSSKAEYIGKNKYDLWLYAYIHSHDGYVCTMYILHVCIFALKSKRIIPYVYIIFKLISKEIKFCESLTLGKGYERVNSQKVEPPLMIL